MRNIKDATLQLDLTSISARVPKVVQKFDPSYVTRYVIIAELIKSLRKETGKNTFRILDVGGYNGAARDLLPEQDITIIDLFKDQKLKKYISYDGKVMPFSDGEFDMVISCDTLEHVPPKNRKQFLDEITRVTNNYLLLCAPFNSPDVAAAELRSDKFYQGLASGQSYIWLKEHREFGLPDKVSFTSALENKGFTHTNFDHTSVDLWEIMLRSSFFLAGNYKPIAPRVAMQLEKANNTYLSEYAFSDFPIQGYRTFFVCSKQQNLNVLLPKYDPAKTAGFISRQMELTGQSVSKISKQLGKERDELEALKRESQQLYQDSLRLLEERNELAQQLTKIRNTAAFKVAQKANVLKKRIHKS